MTDSNPWQPTPNATYEPNITVDPKPSLKRLWPLAAVVVVSLVATGIISFMQLTNQTESEGQVAAASSAGTATLQLQPGSQNYTAGQAVTVNIVANTGLASIDGMQMLANLSGVIPPDLQLTLTPPTGLEVASKEVALGGTSPQFKFALVSQNPTTGLAGQNQSVVVGALTFTAPASGSLQVAFDASLSKMLQHDTGTDILRTPTNGQFTFVAPAVTPSPTPVSTPVLPTPTIIATAKPTPSIIPSLVPTPLPSPSPSPSPTTGMTVLLARWREWPWRWNQLNVQVKADFAPPTTIEVVGFGKLSYNKKTKVYQKVFYTNQKPTQIMIKASNGQQLTVPVQIIKFGK